MNGSCLRQQLQGTKTLLMPGAYNPFTAKLIEREGFDGVYISGAGLANSLALSDNGSLMRDDFVYFARRIAHAVRIPVICDADTGLDSGKSDGVAGTVKAFMRCGLAGMQVEDQVFPKRCGHLSGKEVVAPEIMENKIRQMVWARGRQGKDFVVIARTDARGAANIRQSRQLEESIERGRAYLQAGADVIFPESLQSLSEFKKYRAAIDAPLLANMTEFGRSPMLTARQFQSLGYNIVIYPVSLFRISAGHMRAALRSIRRYGNQRKLTAAMMTRARVQALLDGEPE